MTTQLDRHLPMRGFLTLSALITITAVAAFTLGLYAQPPQAVAPCEYWPILGPQTPAPSEWRAL